MTDPSRMTGPTLSLLPGERVSLSGPGEVLFLGVAKGKGTFKFFAHADVAITRLRHAESSVTTAGQVAKFTLTH